MDKTCDKITPDVLKASVSKEHGVPVDEITVENISIKSGSKKGDGFACEIVAVQFTAIINGNPEVKNYIAKYAPDGPRGEILKLIKAFATEDRTYTWLIPTLQNLRSERDLKPLSFPKCFYSSVEDSLIILENLKETGFEVVKKEIECLSLPAVKMALKELAAFHATSFHFLNTYPGGQKALALKYPDYFSNVIFAGKDMLEKYFGMTANMFGSCVQVTKKYGSEQLSNRMAAYQNIIVETLTNLFESKWKMSYMMHGDAWYNNFLYRYSADEARKPLEVAMLDLQNCRLGRPGLELAYFFCSSTTPQQRKEHFEELFQFYYDQFFEELRGLGDNSEPEFSLQDLRADFDECYPWGFVQGCVHAQIHLVNEESKVGFDLESFGDDEAENRMVESMEVGLMAKAANSPEYRQLVLGLAEEAMLKNII